MVPQRRPLFIFATVFIIALTWAAYTGHAWEDYYITYRASKNLATGHGLVFQIGEKVHTFTSPLGVLLPAMASLLTANKSDEVALWIFRIMSSCALSGAAVIFWHIMRRNFVWRVPTFVLLALFATDAKSVDFSINGMETGFVLLFLAWTLYALLTRPPKLALHLGLAWAGLMWSRPDSFIYIGLLSVGAFLFRRQDADEPTRLDFFKTCLRAGAITTICYAPWFLWAWSYYGSPIPNTIIAKGLESPKFAPHSIFQAIVDFPSHVMWEQSAFHVTFLPTYGGGQNSGWPAWAQTFVFILAIALSLVWLLPFVRREARIASLTFAGGQFYLCSFASFPYAWYLPPLSALGFLILATLFHQAISAVKALKKGGIAERRASQLGWFVTFTAAALVAGCVVMSSLVAYQLRIQQRVIEEGVRRSIGYWLREHAKSSHDSVFLEPLGYIGFYSGLKMLDFPGLAAPEMVEARKRLLVTNPDMHGTNSWPPLIRELQPDWLVLRVFESATLRDADSELINNLYEKVRDFDASEKINQYSFLPGRGYIAFDSVFNVFHKKPGLTNADFNPFAAGSMPLKLAGFTRKDAFAKIREESFRLNVHAPSVLVYPLLAGFRSLHGEFGFEPSAYAGAQGTDGAEFIVTLVDPAAVRTQLFRRMITPMENPSDRGTQKFAVNLPENATGSVEFAITSGPHNSNAFDWTYWSKLQYSVAPK